MTLKRILLIRHGQTAYNVQRRWQGQLDIPLDDTGKAQVKALGAYLRGRPIGAIYSSDLSRAWDTACAVGQAVGVEPIVERRLREINVGIFEGLTHDDMIEKFPEESAAYLTGDPTYVIPNGESRLDVQVRAYQAWQEIIQQANGAEEIACVSHGGTLRHLLPKVLEHNLPDLNDIRIPNTSITTIACDGQHWQLGEIGATPHLLD